MVNGIKDLSSFIQVELGAGGSPLEGQKGFLSMIIAPLSQERRVMRVGVLEGFIMSASLSLLVLWAQVPRTTLCGCEFYLLGGSTPGLSGLSSSYLAFTPFLPVSLSLVGSSKTS